MRIVSENLSFTYNKKSEFKKVALKSVNLTIEEGDFFGIIGKTGSGKSTFIQHLNGILKVESGSLKIGEYDLSNPSKKDRKKLVNLRSKVGMVFQYPEFQLFAETVYEDVAFGLRNFEPQLSDLQIEERVKESLEMVGLDYESVKNCSPFELSGGQKRRVAIAGVLVTNPEILVLDEPVAGLDPLGKRQLLNLLHSIHGGKLKTIIIVSHDIDEVVENCNKVAVFNNGTVVKSSTVKDIFEDEKLLTDNGLDLPLTVKLKKALEKEGVKLNCGVKMEEFIEAVKSEYFK